MRQWHRTLVTGWGLVVASVVLSPPVWASIRVEGGDGADQGFAETITGVESITNNKAKLPGTRVRFDVGDFLVRASSVLVERPGTLLTTSPDLTTKAATNSVYLRWQNGITSRAQVHFRVPSDYLKNGQFRVLLGRSGSTATPPSLSYQVFIEKSVTAFDTAATTQTAVGLVAVTSGSPEEKTLAITTDFGSLAAGDYVTLELWRTDNGSTEDLELYYAEFFAP